MGVCCVAPRGRRADAPGVGVLAMATTRDLSARVIPYRLRRRPEERVRILGVEVDLVRPEEMLLFVSRSIEAGERTIIANHNLHSLSLVRRNPQMASFYRRADLIELDSQPMIAWGRLTGRPTRPFHRCTYLDWRDLFWSTAVKQGWRIFYLGGAPGVAETGAAALRQAWPELKLQVRDGFFDARPDSADAMGVLDEIRSYAPNVLLVGMGMPRQEIWIDLNADRLGPCVIFSVGAAMDYEAGVQAAAPRWMGRAGMEWLYRLVRDPARLAHRYLVEPWGVVPAALRDLCELTFCRRPAAGP